MTSIAIHSSDTIAPSIGNSLTDAFGRLWRRHSYIVPSFAICLIVCIWYVTWGDLNFFERENFCGFYDAQARSILHGHLDVPADAIGFEAFIFRGKTYGYFGVAPAILRMPLVTLFPGMDRRWSRCFMLVGFFLNLVCAYRLTLWVRGPNAILTRADRTLNSLLILSAGLGSTNIFLVSRSYTYHEAIMWGGVFALLFAVTAVKYLAAPSLGRLTLLGVFAFMSFHSRPTAGAGALLALGIIGTILALRSIGIPIFGGIEQWLSRVIGFRSIDEPRKHAAIAVTSILVILTVYFSVNYAKFRTFDGVPVKYYSMYMTNPGRMKITGGRQMHPENIPMTVVSYFGFRGAEFRRDFPWIFLCRQPSILGHPALDVVEQYSSIPVSMPAIGLLALFGIFQILRGQTERERQMRLPIVTLAIGGGIILMTVGITQRYLHDLYPFLIAAAAVGVLRFARPAPAPLYSGEKVGVSGDASSCLAFSNLLKPLACEVDPVCKRPLTPTLSPAYGEEGSNARLAEIPRTPFKIRVLVTLAFIGIVLNCTFSIEYQRMAVWGVSQERRDSFHHFRQSIQTFLGGGPIAVEEE